MTIIVLTMQDNLRSYIHAETILYWKSSSYNGETRTMIVFGEDEYIYVKESPEEVLQLIRTNKEIAQ
jgi:hypothetical protein